MSEVFYNGITIPYSFITQFQQEAVYDDSGTDWHLTKFDISVQGILNSQYMSLIDPEFEVDSPNAKIDNPAQIMALVRTALLTPRKKFSIKFNGHELLPKNQDGNTGNVDAKNGPLPQSCLITQLTNTTFLITYRIIAHYWETRAVSIDQDGNVTATNRPSHGVVYNRWTETVDIDTYNYTRRTRQGKFIIRSDNKDALTADEYRDEMAMLSVPHGFLRESSQYVVSPDGLGIQYTIVDKEIFKQPPQPAFAAEGQYTESAPQRNPVRFIECWVKLYGSKDTSQAKLLETAIAVVTSKINIAAAVIQHGQKFPLKMALESSLIRVGMYDNWVYVEIKGQVSATRGKVGAIPIATRYGIPSVRITETPFSDSIPPSPVPGIPGLMTKGFPVKDYTPPYLLRGSALILLQAAAYYDPSLTNITLSADDDQLGPGLTAIGTGGFA